MRYQLYKADYEETDNTFFLQDQDGIWWSWGKWAIWEQGIPMTRIVGMRIGWGKMRIMTSWIQQKLHPVSRLQFLVETGRHIRGNDILFGSKESNVE